MNTFQQSRKKKRKSLTQLKEEFKSLVVSERGNIRAGYYSSSRPSKIYIDIVPQ